MCGALQGGEGDRLAGSQGGADRPASRSARALVHRAASRLGALDPPNADDPAPAAERDPREWDRLLRACRNDLQATGAALDDVSREIRVGLTVIKGRAQLLRRQAFATGAPDRRLVHAVDEIDRAVGQIEQVLRERLLDLEPDGERDASES